MCNRELTVDSPGCSFIPYYKLPLMLLIHSYFSNLKPFPITFTLPTSVARLLKEYSTHHQLRSHHLEV